jgi:uncharacterized protein (TIGR00255 family)
MIYSMTGFGRAQTVFNGADLNVEISSVNRRNLEISVSLPREWQSLERVIQAAARKGVNRGKLHIQIQASPSAEEAGFHWDEAGLASTLKRLQDAARENNVEWAPTADALVKLAALNKVDMLLPDAESVEPALMEVVGEAVANLVAMRETEGAALGADLEERLNNLTGGLSEIREHSAGTVERYREILLQRLKQAGLELELSDERVLKEIAIFSDRCDIAEEVGRKLEFLLQEVNREFNTIGSKANNIEVSRCVIEAKNEIERIREQIQNIE